jgi:hypothetical protein
VVFLDEMKGLVVEWGLRRKTVLFVRKKDRTMPPIFAKSR